MSGGEVDRVRVIDRAAGAQPLPGIVTRERREVGHLLAGGIGDAQQLPRPHEKGRAGLWSEMALKYCSAERVAHRALSPAAREWKGQRQPSSVARPEYWRASDACP